MRPVLLVPGISNSGPEHWQSLWEARHAGVRRVHQRDWEHPACAEWLATLDDAIRRLDTAPVLVAHSLGCLLVAHWAAQSDRAVHGMLLVAVPDPQGVSFPKEATGFSPVPMTLRARRVTVVSSADDPYSSPEFVSRCVDRWSAEHVRIGAKGHINSSSGLGDWPRGWAIVEAWCSGSAAEETTPFGTRRLDIDGKNYS
jgi:predicted alpha/beta hydrolase family esterase